MAAPTDYEICRDIFQNVNSWLHFAEAKNAALLTFNTAVAIGLITVAAELPLDRQWLCSPIVALTSVLFLGAYVSLLSFFGKLTPPKTAALRLNTPENLWFFGYIATLDLAEYRKKLAIFSGTIDLSAESKPIADQVAINSRIAVIKYSFFNIALQITVFGIVIAPVGALLWGCLIK